jgi:hypothetical protein
MATKPRKAPRKPEPVIATTPHPLAWQRALGLLKAQEGADQSPLRIWITGPRSVGLRNIRHR